MAGVASRLLLPFRQFLFPPSCLHCGRPPGPFPLPLCEHCFEALRPVSAENPATGLLLERLAAGARVSRLEALYVFEPGRPIQSLVHHLKYRGMPALAVRMGVLLGERLAHASDMNGLAGIVPVPLHRAQLRERGYNQSEEFARGIGRVLGLPLMPRLIERIRYTATQTSLNAEERRRNVEGAFRVVPRATPLVRGQKFLVVDDVVTTGATLMAACLTLIGGGATQCTACCLAVASHEGALS